MFFPGLNGIRAIAAMIVVFFHLNSTLWFFGSKPIAYFEARDEMSRHAVVLFFVLSGFLITYLLVKEKERFRNIDIRKFYIRRILRIWPIYYLAILLSVLLIPALIPAQIYKGTAGYALKTAALYSIFIPNFAMIAGYVLPTIVPLWSIGVEEQFYAFWPVCVKYFKNIWLFLTGFLFVYLLLKLILLLSGNQFSDFATHVIYFSYDTMAIGGIGACLYHYKSRYLKLVYNKYLELACWAFFIISCIRGPFDIHYVFNKEIYAFAFIVIILNVSTNPSSLIKLNGRIFDFLGRISYGMYVFHPFVIVLTALLLGPVISKIPGRLIQLFAVSAIVLPVTILVSHLSYTYFESRFLTMKKKFMKVPSTNVKEEAGDSRLMVQPAMSAT